MLKKSKGKMVDEIHLPRMTPAWVLGLVQQRQGTEPSFIMAKTITKTDIDDGQNHLLIPAGFVRAYLIPFLSDKERAAANLLDQERKRKKPSTEDHGDQDLKGWEIKKMKIFESDGVQEPGEGEASNDKKKKKKKEAGRKHEGLCVQVHVGGSMWKAWMVYLKMTRWDSSNGTILKGDEYSKYLVRWSGIKVGDKVELWGFRVGEMGSPCFVLHKIEKEETEGV